MITVFPKTYFAYLDLLGFSQFVLNLEQETLDPSESQDPQTPQQILLYYYNVLEPLVNGSIFSPARKFNPWKSKTETGSQATSDPSSHSYSYILPNSPENSQKDRKYTTNPTDFPNTTPRLNSLIVSDSIFLWTDDLAFTSLENLLDAVKHIIRTNFMWDFGFPLRGGIALGGITFQRVDWDTPKINSIATLVGPALVKAALLEKSQNWAGCTLHEDIITYIESEDPSGSFLKRLQENLMITPYEPPFKRKPEKPHRYVVLWPELFARIPHETFYDIIIQSTFERNGPIVEESIQRKMQNTLDFVHTLRREQNRD